MMVFSLCIMAQEKTVIERIDDGSIRSVRFSPTDKAIPSKGAEGSGTFAPINNEPLNN